MAVENNSTNFKNVEPKISSDEDNFNMLGKF